MKGPKSERQLTKYVAAYARETGQSVTRVRTLISFMAIAGALRESAINRGDSPKFIVKGGVALEMRLRDRARATKDIDLVFDADEGDLVEQLDAALREYDGFRFRIKRNPYKMQNAVRADVAVDFLERPWGTVQVDISHREGEMRVDVVQALEVLQQFGLTSPEEIECLCLEEHIAQKLHAMTQPKSEGRVNERFRDLVDLLLMRELLTDLRAVRMACEQTFKRRATHAWPPEIVLPDEWEEPFRRMADEVNLEFTALTDAAAAVKSFVEQIQAS